ncbi:PepSY-associated TM helix domain-containing protein [uncultured Algimonas sp.]|uniref:PepSY-associated TM helix domain-containing protein n=1 Tax=uncultured Algimonas sp. TaxID=1547920 RepID=UPI00260B7F67|nr:PepSY-associated TM helix domain-containing protein [uncultured Algimonas sp.]
MKTRYAIARDIHGWTGAVLAALLLLIAVTGTLLVFKDDYLRATLPQAAASADLSPDALISATQAAEDAFGTDSLRVLVFATDDLGVHKAYLKTGRSAYLDASGAVIARWDENGRFEDWLFDLHHRLLLGDLGLLVAGLSGLAGSVLVLTGLYAVWPMRLGLRRGLKITQATRLQLRSLHRNLGVIACLPVLILLLTGAALSFPAESRALFDRFGGPEAVAPPTHPSGAVNWDAGFAGAQRAFPDAAPRMAIWPRDGGAPSLRLKQPGEWHPNGRSYVHFAPDRIVVQDALSLGAGREAFNALYPLHAGKAGSGLYKGLTALFGLAVSALSLIGLVSFAKRFRPPSLKRAARLRRVHDPDF